MKRWVLIVGGARSGKSTLAAHLGRELGGDQVLFVATAEGRDEEMRRRIRGHRQSRPPAWRTLEVPREVGAALRAGYRGERAVIVDCLTLLVANVLDAYEDPLSQVAAEAVHREVTELIAAARDVDAHVIVVSNEAGMGLVPPSPLGRAYRDALGTANQQVAAAADEVYLVVAGIPVRIKPGPGC